MAKTVRLVGFLRPRPSNWPEDALRPRAFIGRYEIAGVLRHNDLGITYAARDPQSGREVAIQEFLPIDLAVREAGAPVRPGSPAAVEHFRWGRDRFLVEARKLADLRGAPGIVCVHEVLVANGTACMVMDRVRGDSLATRLACFGSLTPTACEQLLRILLDGLERAHRAGVLHLDIGPANIVLDARDRATLVDFGAGRLALMTRLQSKTTLALSDYAAPEQFAGERPGTHTDVYALAATLHHCVTGRAPLPPSRRSIEMQVPATLAAAGRYPPRLLAGIDAGLGLGAKDRVNSIAAWRQVLGEPFAATTATAAPSRTDAVPDRPAPRTADGPSRTREERPRVAVTSSTRRMFAASLRRSLSQLTNRCRILAARLVRPRPDAATQDRATAAATRPQRAYPERTGGRLPGVVALRERRESLNRGPLAAFVRRASARSRRAALRWGLVTLPGPAGARSRRRRLASAITVLLLVAVVAAVPAYNAVRRSTMEEAEASLSPPTAPRQATDTDRSQREQSELRAIEEAARAEAIARQKQEAAEAKRVQEQNATRRVAEEKARADAAARQQQETDAKARAGAEAKRAQEQEAARRAAEEKARAEAAARQRQEAEAKDRADAEAKRAQEREAARRATEEKARAEAAARQRQEADAKARADAKRAEQEEAARRAAEEKARTESAARQQQEAEARARTEAEAVRIQEQEAAQRAAEEKARTEAAARQQQEAEARARAEAEARRVREQETAQRAAEEKARTEAAARQQQEAETKARAEAEARRAREQEATQRAAEEKARAEAAARQQQEAQAKARAEAEAKRAQEQEAARREAEQKTRAAAAAAERQLDDIIARLVPPASATRSAPPKSEPTADDRRRAEAGESALRLTPTDRARVQIALSSLGYDTKGVDEMFGARTRQMITAWQRKSGEPDTGYLTAPQLQRLQQAAIEALGRYDAEKRRLDEAQRPRPRADVPAGRPSGTGAPAAQRQDGAAPAPPAAYRGSARLPLYPGADDRDFAEYTLDLKVTDTDVSGVVTRDCPGCTAEDRDGRVTYSCAPAGLRPGRTFSLNCGNVSVWGPLDRPRIDNGREAAAVPLQRIGGSQD